MPMRRWIGLWLLISAAVIVVAILCDGVLHVLLAQTAQSLIAGSRTCSLRIMFRDLSHTAWARGISQSYTLPTSFQSPCPPLCPSLYAHPSRSLPRSSTGILC